MKWVIDVEIMIIRQRRKTISARVIDESTIEIRVPWSVSDQMIEKFIESKKDRLQKAILKYQTKEAKKQDLRYYYLGKVYTKIYLASNRDHVSIEGDSIVIEYHSKDAETVLDSFTRNESRRLLEQCLSECMAIFPRLSKPALQIRKMRTRWGSCAYRKGKITLNTKLVHVPYRCIQYVVVHELLHFYYPDHQKQFHQELEKIIQDHRSIEKVLHEYGYLLED